MDRGKVVSKGEGSGEGVDTTLVHDNRDSVLGQGYETSGLPPQAGCPNKDCTQGMPIVVSGTRNIDNPASSTTPEITQERYLDYF